MDSVWIKQNGTMLYVPYSWYHLWAWKRREEEQLPKSGDKETVWRWLPLRAVTFLGGTPSLWSPHKEGDPLFPSSLTTHNTQRKQEIKELTEVPQIIIVLRPEYTRKESEQHQDFFSCAIQIPTRKVKWPPLPNFTILHKDKETTKPVFHDVHILSISHFEILRTWFGSGNELWTVRWST